MVLWSNNTFPVIFSNMSEYMIPFYKVPSRINQNLIHLY